MQLNLPMGMLADACFRQWKDWPGKVAQSIGEAQRSW